MSGDRDLGMCKHGNLYLRGCDECENLYESQAEFIKTAKIYVPSEYQLSLAEGEKIMQKLHDDKLKRISRDDERSIEIAKFRCARGMK